MRGSDPDAAVYWMMRMLEAGEDPLFVLRRMLIFASEDVGNADPRALIVVGERRRRVPAHGHARGPLPDDPRARSISRARPSRTRSRTPGIARKALIEEHGSLPVPMKLRNAVTKLMKQEGYGSGYQYAHDYDEGVVPGETYLPDELVGEALLRADRARRGDDGSARVSRRSVPRARNSAAEVELPSSVSMHASGRGVM